MLQSTLKLSLVLASASAMASTTVTRISATFSQATDQNTSELSAKYIVLSKKDLDPSPSRRPVQEELLLVSIGKDSEFPAYEIAKTSKVVLISPLGANDAPVPTTLKGVLPNGKSFEVSLEKMIHTEEVKPEGTLLKSYCGQNTLPGIPEDSNVVSVCIESGKSLLVE